MLAVQVVDFEQVVKNIAQIVQVDEASAFSNALIYFDEVVDGLDILVVE